MDRTPDLFDAVPQMPDPLTGRELADEGGRRAEQHADAVEPSWSDRARDCLAAYLDAHPGQSFTSEAVVAFAKARGLPKPPDARAWGPTFRSFARAGRIKRQGYVESPDPKQHGSPSTLWKAPEVADDE